MYRILGGPQSRSVLCGELKFLTLSGFELRPLGRPSRSQSLHRLRYRGLIYIKKIFFCRFMGVKYNGMLLKTIIF
jgi:hypothetical protein